MSSQGAPSAKNLTVLVHGTGFAGQGHAAAFRGAGVEVVGMVGRTEHVVRDVANKMNIPFAGCDWHDALRICQPDIVSIATPGGAHYDPIVQAIDAGCHVFVDKPLTHSSETAADLYARAKAKGIKTAYAASFRYAPSVLHAKRLVADGAIGAPTEVECISHFNLDRNIPFGWSHSKAAGGGRLNNNFTHTLSIVSSVVGDEILSVSGETRDDLGRAPIVEGVHNFMTRRDFIPEDLSDPDLEWGESDVEWSYTVLAQLQGPFADKPVSVLFKHGGLVPRYQDDHITFYGTKGAIYLKGHYGTGRLSYYGADKAWQDLPTPDDIAAANPDVPGETEQCWHYLVNEFVKDISGVPVAPYPGFKEGSQYQHIIDLIRENANWTPVPKPG